MKPLGAPAGLGWLPKSISRWRSPPFDAEYGKLSRKQSPNPTLYMRTVGGPDGLAVVGIVPSPPLRARAGGAGWRSSRREPSSATAPRPRGSRRAPRDSRASVAGRGPISRLWTLNLSLPNSSKIRVPPPCRRIRVPATSRAGRAAPDAEAPPRGRPSSAPTRPRSPGGRSRRAPPARTAGPTSRACRCRDRGRAWCGSPRGTGTPRRDPGAATRSGPGRRRGGACPRCAGRRPAAATGLPRRPRRARSRTRRSSRAAPAVLEAPFLRRDLGVRRQHGAEVVAEEQIDRRRVVEGPDGEREEIRGSRPRLPRRSGVSPAGPRPDRLRAESCSRRAHVRTSAASVAATRISPRRCGSWNSLRSSTCGPARFRASSGAPRPRFVCSSWPISSASPKQRRAPQPGLVHPARRRRSGGIVPAISSSTPPRRRRRRTGGRRDRRRPRETPPGRPRTGRCSDRAGCRAARGSSRERRRRARGR